MYNRFIILSIKFEKKSFGEYYLACVKLIDDVNKTIKYVTLIIDEENLTDEIIKDYVNNFVEGDKMNEIKKSAINNTIKRLTGKSIDL